jgi:hypothetical protein
MNEHRNSRDSASSVAQDEACQNDFLRRQAKKKNYAPEKQERRKREPTQSVGGVNKSKHRASVPPETLLASRTVPSDCTAVPPPFVLTRSQTTEDDRHSRLLQDERERKETQVYATTNNVDDRLCHSTKRRANSARSGSSRSHPPRAPRSAEPNVNPGTGLASDKNNTSYPDLKLAQELQDGYKINHNKHSRHSASSVAHDEAYARELQEQYRKDFLRRQAKKNKFAQENRERERQERRKREPTQPAEDGNTAALASSSMSKHRDSAPPEGLLTSPIVPSVYTAVPPPTLSVASPFVSNGSQSTEDKRYARPLQNELEREETQVSATTTNVDVRRSNSTNRSDQAAARRIQQKLQDAEYARRLSVMEKEEAMAAAQALQQQQPSIKTPSRYGRARLIAAILVDTNSAKVSLLFVFGE